MKTTAIPFKTILTSLAAVFCIMAQAAIASPSVSAPMISKTQGMVVVRSAGGFIHAYAGQHLNKGDEIRTGRTGKAYIDFPDNSRVKLGNRAQFVIRDWQQRAGIFSSVLRIFQGAFRYTAGAISKGLHKRDTRITTQTAVLGVRGTDFWGRVQDNETFFLLIEGKVSLAPRYGRTIAYHQAGAAVRISPLAISAPEVLTPATIAPLASETDIQ